MKTGPTSRRRILFRTVAICLGLMVSLLAAEIALRVLSIEPPRLMTKRMLTSPDGVGYHCYPTNPVGELEPLPDVTTGQWSLKDYMLPPRPLPLELLPETPWCVRYDISPQMLRDRIYPPQVPEGVLRIGMVGDSFVFGEGVPYARTLSQQTEKLLGTDYEVVNGGRVGASTELEIAVVKDLRNVLGIRRIIFVYLINDVPLTEDLKARQQLINDLVVIRDGYLDAYEKTAWYRGPSRLARWIGSAWTMRSITDQTIQWYLDSYDRFKNADNLDLLEAQFRELRSIDGVEIAFVIYPLLESLERDYPFAQVHEHVAEMATRSGLDVLDLTPFFLGQDTSSLWVHATDHHPNGRANSIAAHAIVDWLRAKHPEFLKPPSTNP